MAIVENRSTEIGDVMRIESDVPVVGIVTLNNYIDDIQGEQIIDGASVPINLITLSQDLSGIASFDGSSVSFGTNYSNGEVGVLELQKDELEVGKTYKLAFTVKQNTDVFGKLNLYHSSTTAIIQYSQVQVGIDVNVLCLITPTTNDADNNKNLRINISNISVSNGDSIVFTNFTLNEVSTTSRYFKKEFRYSTDGGLNFTNWMDLNNVNVQNIVVSRRDLFVTEIKLTRQGLNATGELVFNSLNIGGIYKELPYKIYGKTIFNDFFTVNDVGVIGWQLNVLEKLYKDGIMPWYMERDTGEEYLIVQPDPIPTYTISSSVTNGTVNDSQIIVTEGGNEVVVFTPNENYIFSSLTVNGQPYTNYSLNENGIVTVGFVNVTEDKSVEAIYVAINQIPYGSLYNFYAVEDARNITNIGWRVPTNNDFNLLISQLGGNILAGKKLKSTRTSPLPHPRWDIPNTDATNEVGFNGVPGGRVNAVSWNETLAVDYVGQKGTWYSSSLNSSSSPYILNIYGQNYSVPSSLAGKASMAYISSKRVGLSVVVVRDATQQELLLPNGTLMEDYIGNDNKVYKTVKIGSFVFINENLKETKYRNGDDIPLLLTYEEWDGLVTGARFEIPYEDLP